VRTYVLDDLLRPAPVGVTGQLFVAGTTLAHGYLGEPGRTAQRFLPDPYAGRAGARMYATGDLVRRRADGALDYVGRRDRRITVRGERIDLGRIEAVLAEHPAVGDCGVVGRDEAGLTAYVSMVGDLRPESAELRRYVADRLPAPLVPRRVVVLPSLPRTPDGRPDLAALAQWPDGPTTGSPPRTALERWLASTWERLLGVPTIAADDNFFDLGGNSLHATQVVAHVREQLGLELPVRELLIHQTLDQLAARIAENVAATDDDLAPTRHLEELDGHRELSDRAVG
jgi:acyl carrier protein